MSKSIFVREDAAVVKRYDVSTSMYELQLSDGMLYNVPKDVLQFGPVHFPNAILNDLGILRTDSVIKVQLRRDVNCSERVFVNAAQCYWSSFNSAPKEQVQKNAFVECPQMELKSSFLYTAERGKSDDHVKVSKKQSIVLAREASAMSNARIEGKIVVGVDDQSNIVGVENEVDDTMKFQSVLRNDIAVCTNWSFAESILFEWITECGHLICIITIPLANQIVLVNGNEMWKRVDTDCVQLKGAYLIDSIKNWIA